MNQMSSNRSHQATALDSKQSTAMRLHGPYSINARMRALSILPALQHESAHVCAIPHCCILLSTCTHAPLMPYYVSKRSLAACLFCKHGHACTASACGLGVLALHSQTPEMPQAPAYTAMC